MRRIYTTLALAIILLSLSCSKGGGPATNLSGDDKHKLYQASINTRDSKLILRVTEALGLTGANGSPTPAYGPFIKEHADWASKNFDFVKENLDPNKAKEYVNSHLPQ